ncbi:MAG: DUF971 domain-containing protein [Planctomycetota bacterium]|nr:DUF971 domain-containing protein [Planctomycetota bacterium]
MDPRPLHLDLKRDQGLRVEWDDGAESFFPLRLLRRLSPSAEQQALREELEANPLAVLPTSAQERGELTAEDAELIGNYAIRIRFSDGHQTGIFSWKYLRSIDAEQNRSRDGERDSR